MSNETLLLLVPFIVGALSVALAVGGVYLYRWLKNAKQGYPKEEEIEAALLPYVYNAIMFAYKTSETFVDEGQDRLRGLDKKVIAGLIYDLLPAELVVGEFIVNLGWLLVAVPKPLFERFVESAFAKFLDWYEDAQAALGDKVLEMVGPKPFLCAA